MTNKKRHPAHNRAKTDTCSQFKNVIEKLKRDEPVRIVGLGDSLTYGWEASFSYFDLFVSKLRADYCGVSITGHNAGVCGDTARGGEKRISRLLDSPTDLVLVQFGINDLYAGVPVDSYKSSASAICRKIIRANAIPLPITSGPLLFPEQQRDIAPFYCALKEVAGAYECPFADIAEHMHAQFDSFKALYYEDGVHPNDSGYRAMADALYEICHTL